MSSPALYVVRPIGPADREALAVAFDRLSPESRYRRFLAPKTELTPRELTRFTEVDHVNDEALVAVEPLSGRLVGVARYAVYPGQTDIADFAIVVADAWQGCGIGKSLARRVIERARANGFATLTASTLWDNEPARGLLAGLGFRALRTVSGVIDLELSLQAAQPDSVGRARWSSVS